MKSVPRIICVGELTVAGKQFVQALQTNGLGPIAHEKSPQVFSEATGKSQVHIVLVEANSESKHVIQELRQSGQRLYLVWFGRTFAKEDLQFAIEQRVFTVFENTRAEDKKVQESIRKLVKIVEQVEVYEKMLQSVKGILIQAEAELPKTLLTEMKTAIVKLERHAIDSHFLGEVATSATVNDAKLMFHRTQTFGDSLETIQELERTGVLWVRGGLHGEEGKVEFLQGKVLAAQSGDVSGLKAIYRMFLWDEPKFLFTRRDPKEALVHEYLNSSIQHICTEGKELKARFERIRRDLPPGNLRLELEPTSIHSGTTLKAPEFSTLASIVEFGLVSHVLDFNPLPDVPIYESLISLRRTNVIRVAV